MLKPIIKSFDELTTSELYKIIQIRTEIFVVEQDCVYQDLDFKDQKALHLFFTKNEEIIAYTRLFKPGDYFTEASIGRVVVRESARKDGLGHILMKASISAIEAHFNTKNIKIGAQTYLEKFYESHGFKQVGEGYLEDGIPHIHMVK
ncbi:GNAT family N-acetyltransferase [Urechidicola vernalis]|uniref:GNAT family N-acetyltransferase n=1 Tax=Urechidicola vernalis TaxID=3075600 RepID=A0ABU2Y6G2_9FLAO|nr:GNAT family N-acetyltransferase [Urechidicola sp. P050]MDT0553632.1 GNAT family N-acetyltransferase [Urechidicola sp. P050]